MREHSDIVCSKTMLNRKSEFVDHLASSWGDDGRADDDALFIGDQLYEPIAEITRVATRHDV